jgi:hypothetical protein
MRCFGSGKKKSKRRRGDDCRHGEASIAKACTVVLAFGKPHPRRGGSIHTNLNGRDMALSTAKAPR